MMKRSVHIQEWTDFLLSFFDKARVFRLPLPPSQNRVMELLLANSDPQLQGLDENGCSSPQKPHNILLAHTAGWSSAAS
jgi:hypothetical protein